MPEIDELRRRGISLITKGGWIVTGSLLFLAIPQGWIGVATALASAALNLVPTRNMRAGRIDFRARIAVAFMAALQPALLIFTMHNTGWQVDMHVLFLIALAALTLLGDIRILLIAAALIVAYHIAFSVVVSGWKPPLGIEPSHVIFHVATVVLLGWILAQITLNLGSIIAQLDSARMERKCQAEQLEEAISSVDRERAARKALEVKQETQSQPNIEEISSDFEETVSGVTHAIAATAQLLERTAKTLNQVASDTGDQASNVAESAQTATRTAQTVARGVAELSGSIASIAVNVGQQKDMTTRATRRSSIGGEAVGSLSDRSDTIGEATRAIVRIAERTNLLSLNAAIEAATAGPAGRGFTVVAQEVKALAGQAAEAATKIDELLSGVRCGTLEAEKSFAEIDAVVADLDKAAIAMRGDVERQRQSADAIEDYARKAADDVSEMAEHSQKLAITAQSARQLTGELDHATDALFKNVKTLEDSSAKFAALLRAA